MYVHTYFLKIIICYIDIFQFLKKKIKYSEIIQKMEY